MSALWTALMEGETKESLATMVCELREREKDGTASLRSGGPSATPSDARTPIIVLPHGHTLAQRSRAASASRPQATTHGLGESRHDGNE